MTDDRLVERLSRLLPVIAAALGSEWFALAELLDDDYPAVRLAVTAIGIPRAQIGQLFARGVGVPIDGYVLERGGIELHRRLWQVSAIV